MRSWSPPVRPTSIRSCPGSHLAGILTPTAVTRLAAAGVDLGEVAWVGPSPPPVDAHHVEGTAIRFEGETRVQAVVVDPGDGEQRIACDTAVVELGTYPRDGLARMAGGAARVAGNAAGPPDLPACPAAGTVCPCAGVSVDDLDAVWERGFRELELIKRATLAGTGTCQGGVCSPYLRSFVADRGGELQPSFTARPPARQLTLGEAADGHHFPPIQRTTLDAIHREAGARMDRMGGWWRPWTYGDADAEYRAVRERVSLCDVGTLGKMLVRGPDAAEFLEFLYPARIADLRPGRSRYALLLAESGAVFDDGLVSRLDEETFALTFTTGGAGVAEAWVRDWATGTGRDVRIMDRTHSLGAINVTGPMATELMQRAGIDELPRFMGHTRTEAARVPCRIYRLSFTGEVSYEIHHPASASPGLWAQLMSAGRDLGVAPHGLRTLQTLRLEKGHIIVGMDTEPDSTPRRLGMEWAVDFGKGDFLGRAALERTDGLPLDRRLSGFTLDGPAPTDGTPLHLPSGEMGGWVTSAAWSPVLERSVALAWSRLVDGDVPDSVEIDGRPARRTDPPFYDPGGARARA
jgi:sarcosine oxidase, subunit alpha